MLYHLSEIIVFVLLLPIFMNIVLPLAMLVGWTLWRGVKLLLAGPRSVSEEDGLSAQSLTAR